MSPPSEDQMRATIAALEASKRERRLAYMAEWRKENFLKVQANQIKYRDRKKAATAAALEASRAVREAAADREALSRVVKNTSLLLERMAGERPRKR